MTDSITTPPGSDVFVSYKREERDRIAPMIARLKDCGLKVWFDAALDPGTTFDEEIARELALAKAHLVVWSRASTTSRWVRSEATLGATRKVLIPVYLEPCTVLPPFNLDHTVDLSAWNGEGTSAEWTAVLTRIGQLIGRPAIADWEQVRESPTPSALRLFLSAHPSDSLAERARLQLYKLEIDTVRKRLAAELQLSPQALSDWEAPHRKELADREAMALSERQAFADDIKTLRMTHAKEIQKLLEMSQKQTSERASLENQLEAATLEATQTRDSLHKTAEQLKALQDQQRAVPETAKSESDRLWYLFRTETLIVVTALCVFGLALPLVYLASFYLPSTSFYDGVAALTIPVCFLLALPGLIVKRLRPLMHTANAAVVVIAYVSYAYIHGTTALISDGPAYIMLSGGLVTYIALIILASRWVQKRQGNVEA